MICSTTTHRVWPAAGVGLLGSLLLAYYPWARGYLPHDTLMTVLRHASWIRSEHGGFLATGLAVVGALLLSWAWLAVRPGRVGRAPWRLLLVLWSLPLVAIPPVLSQDAFAYAAQAWVLQQGMDPYVVAQGTLSPLSLGVWPLWAQTTSVYPPLMLYAQVLVLFLAGPHPLWAPTGMRLLAIVGVAVVVSLLPRLARDADIDEDHAMWSLACNPLTVMILIGGAHNDALMIAALAVAVWLVRRPGSRGFLLSSAQHGVAALFKQAAVIAAPGIVLHGMTPQERQEASRLRLVTRVVVAGALGGAVFLAVSFGTGLGLGWMNDSAGNPGMVRSLAPLSWLNEWMRDHGHATPAFGRAMTVLSLVLTLTGIAWAGLRFARSQPLLFSGLCLLSYSVFGLAMQPWYPMWAGLFLVLTPMGRRWRVICAGCVVSLSVMAVLIERFSTPEVVLACSALTALILRWVLRRPAPVDGEVA